ncbi:hypothetical protein V8J88_01885 [Massilia sp. W12]|uniref:hypothetical protein n=1 Tax=Massilia sp. W12 TaxID=3126507 RepID=UPI0030D366BB
MSIFSARLSALALAMLSFQAFAYQSGSTGVDGAFNPTVSMEVQLPPNGIFNFTDVNIPAGVTIRFKKNQANTPVYILASGNVNIAGKIDLRGTDSPAVGIAGDGIQADDGMPGIGGPGGFDGGRGGRYDPANLAANMHAGAGMGPGGGLGGLAGIAQAQACDLGRAAMENGMGGAHATVGSNRSFQSCHSSKWPLNAAAKAYGSIELQPLIGGSGGGGGIGSNRHAGSGGGGGGGAILIAASGAINISSTGEIVANGGHSGRIPDGSVSLSNFGGGGAGGAIRLIASTVSGSGKLQAKGGCAYHVYSTPVFCGVEWSGGANGGAEGRIRIEADVLTYNGSAEPARTMGAPEPVFVSAIPSLRIAAVAGQNAPANPSGNADLTFPANLSNPVNVVLETNNIPPGNTVSLRIIPAYGNAQTVVSPALSGNNERASATVSVNLPQGPSTLQAVASFTLSIAQGNKLARYAGHEQVAQVEIAGALGQSATMASLITVSGKRYEVPLTVLQMAGFTV